ncbi:unnamed protein product [Meloidogyne enterolobii]|uniref:Uncharacterized protein n=1 Tax=Meloidogyne enterolobii TaxID=390850 RepID=A0ACB1AMC8_MELEN
MPKMWDLLRKSKYYLINVHPLGQFPFPNIPKRIVNIGGIEVEIEGILNEIEEEKRLKEKEKNKWLTGFLKNKVKEHFFEDPVFEWIKKVFNNFVMSRVFPRFSNFNELKNNTLSKLENTI